MDKRLLLMELAAQTEGKEKGVTASMTWDQVINYNKCMAKSLGNYLLSEHFRLISLPLQ